MTETEVERFLADDNQEKRKARGGRAVGKVSPRVIQMPSDFDRNWHRQAAVILWVVVATGEVKVKRWPLPSEFITQGEEAAADGGEREKEKHKTEACS